MSERTRPEAYVSPLMAMIELVRGQMTDAANYERTERGITRFCANPLHVNAFLAGAERADKAEQQLAALTEVHERLRTLSENWEERAAAMAREMPVHLGSTIRATRRCKRELDALLSPREGTEVLEDQELTNDLTRRDTQTLREGQPAASTDGGKS